MRLKRLSLTILATVAIILGGISALSGVASATPSSTDAFVRVTSLCLGPGTDAGIPGSGTAAAGEYIIRVRHESGAAPVSFNLQVGGTVLSGPHSIGGGESQYYNLPAGSNGVKAVPVGNWTNSYRGTASTPQKACTTPPTTSTTTTSTTVAPTTAPSTTVAPSTTQPEAPSTTTYVTPSSTVVEREVPVLVPDESAPYNCEELGYFDITTEDPLYHADLDADKDGVACEETTELALTGSSDGPMAAAGILLLVVGGILLVARRRMVTA